MAKKEIRKFNFGKGSIELRVEQNGEKRTITGKIPYDKQSRYMGYHEVIRPTAFNKTLADKADVRMLWGHDDNKVLGRVKNGTLVLDNRTDGLYLTCDIADTSDGNDVVTLINRGDIDSLSFGFHVIKDTWDYANNIRYLEEVKLIEISVVTFPAYDDTQVNLRSLFEKRSIDVDKLEDVLTKDDKDLSKEDRDYLSNLMSKLVTINIEDKKEDRKEDQADVNKPSTDTWDIRSLDADLEILELSKKYY